MKPLLLLLLLSTSTALSLPLHQDPHHHTLDSVLSEVFTLCDTDTSSDLSHAELASCGLSYLSTALKVYDIENASRQYSWQQVAKAFIAHSSQGGDDPRELALKVRGEWLDKKMSKVKSYIFGGSASKVPLLARNGVEASEKTVDRFFQIFDANHDG